MSSLRRNCSLWIGPWPSFHCSRFAASTAGEGTMAFLTLGKQQLKELSVTISLLAGRRNMTSPQYQSGDTSNDVLFRLDAIHPRPSLNYRIIAQSELEVQDVQNGSSHEYEHFYI